MFHGREGGERPGLGQVAAFCSGRSQGEADAWVKDRQEVYKASNGYLEEIRDSGKDVYCDADTDVEFLEYAAYRLYDVKIRNVYEEDNRQINEDYVILESAIEE